MGNKRSWRKKTGGEEWTGKGHVSEEELLNRVILSKALQAHAAGQTMQLRAGNEVLEISPRSARDVMRASGQYPEEKERRRKKR